MSSLPSIVESALIMGEELLTMQGVNPCELVKGRIVPKSPTGGEHGLIEFRFAKSLDDFVGKKKLGWVLTGEVGIYTGRNPDTVRGADVLFISKDRLATRPKKGFLDVAPELVIEIFSPTDNWKEMECKVQEYLVIGVNCVWVVNPTQRTVSIYRAGAGKQSLTENDTLVGEDILADFQLEISELFED